MQHIDSEPQPGFYGSYLPGAWWTAAQLGERQQVTSSPCSTGTRGFTPSLSTSLPQALLLLATCKPATLHHAAASSTTVRPHGPLAVRPWRSGAEQSRACCATAANAPADQDPDGRADQGPDAWTHGGAYPRANERAHRGPYARPYSR